MNPTDRQRIIVRSDDAVALISVITEGKISHEEMVDNAAALLGLSDEVFDKLLDLLDVRHKGPKYGKDWGVDNDLGESRYSMLRKK